MCHGCTAHEQRPRLKAVNGRASEARETLSVVYKFELVWYMYIYGYGGMCAIIVAHAMHT